MFRAFGLILSGLFLLSCNNLFASETPPPATLGMRALEQITADFKWSKNSLTQVTKTTNSKMRTVYDSEMNVDALFAGDAFRIRFNDNTPAHPLPISTVCYDGKIMKDLVETRAGKKTLDIGRGSERFLDFTLEFGQIFGIYSFSDHETLKEHFSSNGTVFPTTLEGIESPNEPGCVDLTFKYANVIEMCRVDIRGKLIRKYEEKYGDVDVIVEVAEFKEDGGRRVPTRAVRTVTDSDSKSVDTFQFKVCELVNATNTSVSKLMDIETPNGTIVVDELGNTAYEITATGRKPAPFWDPVAGKVVKAAPTTRPIGRD